VRLSKTLPFVVTADHRPRGLDRADLRGLILPRTAFAAAGAGLISAAPLQLSLF
jgi:hypothetical protein